MNFADRFPADPRYQVVFSRCEGVDGWIADHWRAELHDHGDGSRAETGHYSHPLAVAWVTDYPDPTGPVLDYLIVLDQWRGSDLGPRLAAECQRRWPGINFTPRFDPSGGFRGEA
jgi:hypothetical protein